MELKHMIPKIVSILILLLIVPYGIETIANRTEFGQQVFF